MRCPWYPAWISDSLIAHGGVKVALEDIIRLKLFPVFNAVDDVLNITGILALKLSWRIVFQLVESLQITVRR